jgi:hypothetical protein
MDKEMIWYQARILTENGTQLFKHVQSREQAEAMINKHRYNFTGDHATYKIIKMKQQLHSIDSDDSGSLIPNWILKPV